VGFFFLEQLLYENDKCAEDIFAYQRNLII
jgi:hypothetical protein